jgi:RecA-family ATPase
MALLKTYHAVEKRDLTTDEKRSVVSTLFQVLKWNTETEAFIRCPGESAHTKTTAQADCRVCIDERVPTISCFHSSCSEAVAMANYSMRSTLGRLSVGGLSDNQQKPFRARSAAVAQPAQLPQRIEFQPVPLPAAKVTHIQFLKACFLPGEFIAFCVPKPRYAPSGEIEGFVPTGGQTVERDELIQLIETAGSVQQFFTQTPSVYLRVNPLQEGGSKDEDVTQYRHVLLEIDTDENGEEVSAEKQFGAFVSSGLPISAVVFSGGKSLHAWVRVDAKDAEEFRERGKVAFERMRQFLLPDVKCLNPSRYSRFPGALRLVSPLNAIPEQHREQSLVAVGLGAVDWPTYERERVEELYGERIDVAALCSYETQHDPNNVLGNRWLCKGAGAMFLGQSGVGKSMLNMQLAVGWALSGEKEFDRFTFNIQPVHPLKVLIIQAENDIGDLAEMLQGLCKNGISPSAVRQLSNRLILHRNTQHTGADFLRTYEGLVRLHRPDLAFIDPLLNYLGEDINDQAAASAYCHELSRIGSETGVITALVHHFGKPKSSRDSTVSTDSDLAYLGLGSSVFTNWAREVVTLCRIAGDCETPTFRLDCSKRRKRAGLLSMERDSLGKAASGVCISHSPDVSKYGMLWIQRAFPEVEEPKKRGK